MNCCFCGFCWRCRQPWTGVGMRLCQNRFYFDSSADPHCRCPKWITCSHCQQTVSVVNGVISAHWVIDPAPLQLPPINIQVTVRPEKPARLNKKRSQRW